MVKKLAFGLCLSFAAVPAIAGNEMISAPQMTAIQVAFDISSEDPMANPDRISPARMSVIAAAYASHNVAPETDSLSYMTLAEMWKAYQTHNPQSAVLASAN